MTISPTMEAPVKASANYNDNSRLQRKAHSSMMDLLPTDFQGHIPPEARIPKQSYTDQVWFQANQLLWLTTGHVKVKIRKAFPTCFSPCLWSKGPFTNTTSARPPN